MVENKKKNKTSLSKLVNKMYINVADVTAVDRLETG